MNTSVGVALLVRSFGHTLIGYRMPTGFRLAPSGQSQAIERRVCTTVTEMMATYYLPRVLRKLREQAPGIVVEVVASDQVRDVIRARPI